MKQNKILLGVIIVIVLVGAFRLFVYDSYRMPGAVSPETAATSDGGTLTLDIPDSALPPGVTKDQIAVEPIPVSELPKNVREFNPSYAFRLEPDGIKFANPIKFTLRVPSNNGAIPILLHISTDEIETLDDISVAFQSDAMMTITGSITHFSNIAVSFDNEISVSMPEDMGSFWVGESFNVPVTITVSGTDEKGRDKEVLYQPRYKFSGNRYDQHSTDISFEAHAPVKPDYIENKPAPMTITSKSSPLSVSGDFTCVSAGKGTIRYVGSLSPLNSNDPDLSLFEFETKVECLGAKVISWDIQTECGGSAKIAAVLDDLSEVEKVYLVLKRIGGKDFGVQSSSFDTFNKKLHAALALPPETYYAEVWATSERGVDYRAGMKEFTIKPCDDEGFFIPIPADGEPGIPIDFPSTPTPPITPPPPTPTPLTPTPKISCNIPAFQACANTFNLQGCINACPYVSTTCPPGTPPGTDCKKTDKSCSDACWSTADRHIASCLASSSCTKEEVIAGGGGARR